MASTMPWDTASPESTHWSHLIPQAEGTLCCPLLPSPIHNKEDMLCWLSPAVWDLPVQACGILKGLLPSCCSPRLALSIRPSILLPCLLFFRTWVLAEPRLLGQGRTQRPRHTFVPL